METGQLLRDIEELGGVFRRLGWKRRLPALRAFHAAVRTGVDETGSWNLQHLARMRSLVQLGPSPLQVACRCPRCPEPRPGFWSGTRTVLHLEDRWLSECTTCGEQWVCLDARYVATTEAAPDSGATNVTAIDATTTTETAIGFGDTPASAGRR